MRLCTILSGGKPAVGVKLGDGKIVDLSKQMPRGPKSVVEILAGGKKLQQAVLKACAKVKPGATVSEKSARYLTPIPAPGKILCIGLNYRAHAIEGGNAIPDYPAVFMRCTTSLAAPDAALILIDALSSSESLGMGTAFTTTENASQPTRFMAADTDTLVLDEDMQPVVPGSGVVGRVARGGLLPRGYYKDSDKTAKTFVEIGGKIYCMAGDHAAVEADGSMTLLGRGSQCINSAGEKIFPEEVEEALKTHPAVEDALVFGVPDETWGQSVNAVVEAEGLSQAELVAHVRKSLAAYKSPKRIVFVAKVPRAPNGKADYATARAMAEAA